jgi:hypothetical protein
MNHEISIDILNEVAGPTLLYKLMQRQHKQSPLLLHRQLRYSKSRHIVFEMIIFNCAQMIDSLPGVRVMCWKLRLVN